MMQIEIVEVGPRDGYQGIQAFIPTERKIDHLRRLVATGLKRIEIGAFVSPRAIPQFRDVDEVLDAALKMEGLEAQVLVPNEKCGRRALDAGARHLAFVLSVSPAHNQANVRRSPLESVSEYARFIETAGPDSRIRLYLSTAFDCPFTGCVREDDVLALLQMIVPLRNDIEVCLCDTTGRAVPDQVERLFTRAMAHFPKVGRWAVHTHDTYGLGCANAYAAWRAGVRIADAAYAGLGGCPFAPGASGNVASEDLVWMFERMGIATGIDLAALLDVARNGAQITGGISGGRVRAAFDATAARRNGLSRTCM